MSNTTETVPLINPDAYPQMVEMMQDTVRRNIEIIDRSEVLIERLEECESLLNPKECELAIQALRVLINEKESGIDDAEAGIAQLKEAALQNASKVFAETGIVIEVPAL